MPEFTVAGHMDPSPAASDVDVESSPASPPADGASAMLPSVFSVFGVPPSPSGAGAQVPSVPSAIPGAATDAESRVLTDAGTFTVISGRSNDLLKSGMSRTIDVFTTIVPEVVLVPLKVACPPRTSRQLLW
jgi:hypothetical protein